MECFLCNIDNNNNINEVSFDKYNYTSLRYPIISLSYAYKCNCIHLYAHNKCLKNKFNCPTCKKCTKPVTNVKTIIDYIFYLPIILLKKNRKRIKLFNYISFFMGFSYFYHYNKTIIVICMIYFFLIDYMKKYLLFEY